jgi:hypothetical protein
MSEIENNYLKSSNSMMLGVGAGSIAGSPPRKQMKNSVDSAMLMHGTDPSIQIQFF